MVDVCGYILFESHHNECRFFFVDYFHLYQRLILIYDIIIICMTNGLRMVWFSCRDVIWKLFFKVRHIIIRWVYSQSSAVHLAWNVVCHFDLTLHADHFIWLRYLNTSRTNQKL